MAYKHAKPSGRPRFFWVVLVLAVLLMLSFAGLTYSRYVLQWTPGRTTAQSPPFYFTSDLLAEGDAPVYRLSDFDAGGEIVFQLRNYADELRVSGMDIQYAVSAPSVPTAVIESSGMLKAGGAGGTEETVRLTIPEAAFTNGKATVQVKAEATSPYGQSLSAVFELYQHIKTVSHQVSDSAGSNTAALVITTSDDRGTVRIVYPETVLPDSTDARLTIDSANRACTINAEARAQYTITFFKQNPAEVFTDQSFTVQ